MSAINSRSTNAKPTSPSAQQPLFRIEVLQVRREGWLGAISLAQPIGVRALTALAAAISLGILLFLLFGSYTRRERVSGQLVSTQGLATVVAPVAGVLRELRINEGQRVRDGQVLALIVVPRATASGSTVEALGRGIEQRRDSLGTTLRAEAQRLSVRKSGLEEQLADARRELDHIGSEIAIRERQITIASETLQRMRQLRDQNYVSDLQAKQQEAVVLDGRASVQALLRQSTSVRRLVAQLRQQLNELPTQHDSQSAEISRSMAVLERERIETQASSEFQVNAAVAGVVASQSVKVGQSLQVGQPLMSLLPGEGKLEAELLVPSRSIGFISPGDRVLLRYDAYPYQKFGHQSGRVARITRSALESGELGAFADRVSKGESFYRVVVILDRQAVRAFGREEILKPGMQLEADILGESRRLIEWVFEPLYSVRGRVREQ